MSDKPKRFQRFTALESVAIPVGGIGGYVAGAKEYQKLTHYPTNIEEPHNPHLWHPNMLETGAVVVGPAIVGAVALALVSMAARRVAHHFMDHGEQPPTVEAQVPVQG